MADASQPIRERCNQRPSPLLASVFAILWCIIVWFTILFSTRNPKDKVPIDRIMNASAEYLPFNKDVIDRIMNASAEYLPFNKDAM